MVESELVVGPALRCKSCGAVLEASRVVLASRLASCGGCNQVFALGTGSTAIAAQRVIPEAFEDDDATRAGEPGYRELARPARTTWRFRGAVEAGVSLVFAGLGLVGSIAFLGIVELTAGRTMTLVGVAMTSPILLVGLAFLYPGLVMLVNRRTLTVEAGSISLRSGPLPWPGKTLPRQGAISAQAHGRSARGDAAPGWVVRILGANRRATPLVGHLTEEEARYLADEISEALESRLTPESPE